MDSMGKLSIDIPTGSLAEFCHRWKVKELSLFGSVLHEDFREDSEDELAGLFGRKADLVMKGGLRNPIRRREILKTRQVVYAA